MTVGEIMAGTVRSIVGGYAQLLGIDPITAGISLGAIVIWFAFVGWSAVSDTDT